MTVAPASRHTRANVLSVGTARLFNWPDCGQAARCLPKKSFWPRTRMWPRSRAMEGVTSPTRVSGSAWVALGILALWANRREPLQPLGQSGTAREPGLRRMIWRVLRSPESVVRKRKTRSAVSHVAILQILRLACRRSLLFPESRSPFATHGGIPLILLSIVQNFLGTVGRRSCSIGNASAHDAQQAPCAVRPAERRPNPPDLIGSVVMSRAVEICSWLPVRRIATTAAKRIGDH